VFRRRQASGPSSGVLTKAALDYGRLGWSVIPIEPRGKRPLVRWQVFQHRRAEPTEIGDWFKRWPEANIAVVTGVVSGLVVLDLDPRHGAQESLAALLGERGSLSETVEARTGGGGRHLYFAHPGEMVRNRVGIAPGIDLRGDGGYVVAPPSMHACGEPYRWTRAPEVFRVAPLPTWLLEAASDERARHGRPLSHWRELLRDGVAEGERNDTVASLAGHLLRYGVDPEVATELLLAWNQSRCRPPLDAEEVVRTVRSITRLHEREAAGGD
jgi:hypothetical protein